MKTYSKLAAIGAAAGLLSAGIAFGPAAAAGGWGKQAGHGGKGLHRMMKRLDADSNGELTIQEVEAGQAKRFGEVDSNGDGVVDASEFKARIMKRMERRAERRADRMLRRLDADRDGKVSAAEFSERAKRRFVEYDLNDDGTLSGDELPGKRDRGNKRRDDRY